MLELTKPTCFRSSRQSEWPYSFPRTWIVPDDGVTYPVTQLKRVVFPDPFAPRITQFSSGSTIHEIPRRISVPRRTTRRSRIEMMAMSLNVFACGLPERPRRASDHHFK